MDKKPIIISVGGSLINPGEVDLVFLKQFQRLILARVEAGQRFILIAGGGRPARAYQEALAALGGKGLAELDWMGIYATRLNAQLARLMFGRKAHSAIVEDPNRRVPFREKILVAGGWRPGRSTDDDAVRLAKIYGADTVINLSNIDYVYDKDPRKFPAARKIERMSWPELRRIVGSKWDPGKNAPFDPTAAKLAQKLKLRVIIANGRRLPNLKNILTGRPFRGTQIF
ncbi:MAG TPA: UMP kinase [Patescibacteria group bacterium]|nr:UMP kinase [Patescibacteria group bacterium]